MLFFILWIISIILTYILARENLIYDGYNERSIVGTLLYSQELIKMMFFIALMIIPAINIIVFSVDYLCLRSINCSYEDTYNFIDKIFFIKRKNNK